MPLRKNRRKRKINPPLQKRAKKKGEQNGKADGDNTDQSILFNNIISGFRNKVKVQ